VGSDLAKNSGFLRAIKIHSMTSFIGEVKALAVAVRFYSMLKIPAEYDRDTLLAEFMDISHQVSHCFNTGCLLLFARELW
jgi:hypothetical protein